MRIRKATLALLAIFCLTCAFAQRKVTPVESSDELKIVTKEELKVLRQRAKSVQMLSDSVLQDSLRRDSIEKAAKQVKYPLLYSTSLGVNFWDPIAMALGQSYGEVEVWAALNLRNRFIPIVEVGMGTANSTPENGNYTYKNKLSLYGRVGMNYNFMFKSDPKYLLFGGLRFGASSFNYDITNISYTNGYWGNQTTFDILNQKGSAMWMELVAGIQVELVKTSRWAGLSATTSPSASREHPIPTRGTFRATERGKCLSTSDCRPSTPCRSANGKSRKTCWKTERNPLPLRANGNRTCPPTLRQ